MQTGPSITAASLIEALVDEGVLDEARLVSLLGPARHDVQLNRLEAALVKENVIASNRLLLVKGAVAGLPILDDPRIRVTDRLPRDLARQAGALTLDLPRPSVAMVEDLPMNVEAVAQALQVPSFEIYLITVVQFAELYKQVYTQEQSDPRPSCKSIFEVLDEAVAMRATDVHLAVAAPPSMRVDGELQKLNRLPLDETWMATEVAKICSPRHLAELQEFHRTDFAYSYGASRFRVNVYHDRYGTALAARKLSSKLPTMNELQLPPAVRKFAEEERGLILVTGPTGSGKSTTLAALLNEINTNQSRHILTLEDPIEFYLPTNQRSVVNQRELNEHFESFPDALRAALRQDPDVILVGELRDIETIRTALQAAETGHLVFGTLHTYDAASSVARVVSAFPPEEQDQVRSQLAYILKGVVSQTLLPLANAQGRVAAYEVMVSTPAVSNNLRKQDGLTQIKQTIETSAKDGMQTMEMALADLCKRQLVRPVDAEFKARNPEDFRRLLQQNKVA